MEIKVIDIEKEKDDNVIVGQANFSIFTTDDLYTSLITAAPNISVGVAMNEAEPKLVRANSNNDRLGQLASKNALKIGASHVFVIFIEKAFPINVLQTIKNVAGVCNIYVATGNKTQIIIGETELGRAVLGAVDGTAVNKIENNEDKKQRRDLVKKIGYSLP
ncbi:MAG: adenosine monophosphate-protein transferase [Candidatus Lokiarchaeota archaeon]|nr:adenosine monophosphate-protein transferase [Candidatus Lokiarchaeota archaeon]